MKTIEDIKLEAKISKMIIATFDGLLAPDGQAVMHRDFVDISEALATKIIETIRGAA